MFDNFRSHVQWKRLGMAFSGGLLISVGQFSPTYAQFTPGASRLPQKGVQFQLRSATSTLGQLETLINNIDEKKLVTAAESEKISQSTFEYGKTIKSALDIALKDASTLAETKGVQGNITSLDAFEKTEKANQPRLEQIELKVKSLEKKIRSGTVKIDAASIQQFTVPERREFLDALEAPARRTYIKQQPVLFKPAINLDVQRDPLKSMDKSSIYGLKFAPTNTSASTTTFDGTSRPPSLYAAAAGPCVGLAISRNWPALAVCVANAGSQATSIYNDFVRCWNGASGWFKWLKRSYCVAKLIARIA
jgi:anti-sigma28 factor (negative regulator of flagellin synthesis)